MKKALIQPDGRIAQVVATADIFDVHGDLIWEDCADDVSPETHEFVNGAVVAKTPIEPNPDTAGFIQAVKEVLGGVVAASKIPTRIDFFAAVQSCQWGDVQALLIDALNNTYISADQLKAIKTAAVSFNIPIFKK